MDICSWQCTILCISMPTFNHVVRFQQVNPIIRDRLQTHSKIIKVDVFKYTHLTVMYFFLAAASITSVIAWYLIMPVFFTFAVASTIFIATYNDVSRKDLDVFMEQSVHCMSITECCCIHRLWSDPKSVVWTRSGFKILAGAGGTLAVLNTWEYSNNFATKHHFIVSIIWCISIGCWFLSCVPVLISLIQCAAKEIHTVNPKSIRNKVNNY